MNILKKINNKYYQECDVHLIGTNKAENALIKYDGQRNLIWQYKPNEFFTQAYLNEVHSKSYHLFITSDEEIKEDDWVFISANNIKQVQEITNKHNNIVVDNATYLPCDCLKIISTTNASLVLSQPSIQFINKFIEEYNKGNIIKSILVEYNDDWNEELREVYPDDKDLYQPTLVINPNNTINILAKDRWTKDEHCTDMQYYMEYCQTNGYVTPMKWLDELKHY